MTSPSPAFKYDVTSPTIDYTTLKIELETTGDVTTKIDLIPFHPNMADLKDLSNNNYILFNAHIKITMNDLKNASNMYPTIIGADFPKIFTTFPKYKKLIEFISDETKHISDDTLLINSSQKADYPQYFSQTQDLSLDEEDVKTIKKKGILTDNEIIINNIELIRKLFLPIKGRFFILGREYVIRKSKYKPKYDASTTQTKTKNDYEKKTKLYFNVVFTLDLVDATANPALGNFTRLNCKEKKKSFLKDINELFGINLDFWQAPATGQAPAVAAQAQTITKNRGYTKVQTDWEEKNRNRSNNPQDKAVAVTVQDKKYEEVNEEYMKIPEGWRKEMDEVDITILNLIDAINKRLAEISDLNEKKLGEYGDKQIDALKKEISVMLEGSSTINKTKITKADLREFENKKEKIINDKYTRKFVEDLAIKQTAINTLESEEKALYDKLKINPNDIEAKQNLTRIQTDILKKKPPIELLQKKYGANGEQLIKRWNLARNKMLELKNTLKKKRTDEEMKISSATINTELSEKMKEIGEVEKNIRLKQFTMGKFDEMTKSEKDEYTKTNEKETIQQPSDSLETLQTNLKNLKDEYWEIADQFERFNQSVQEKNKLIQRDLTRIKALKTSIQSSNQTKQTKIAESQKKERETDYTISQILKRIKDYEAEDNVKKLENKKNVSVIKDENKKLLDYKKQIEDEKKEREKIQDDMKIDKALQEDLELKEKWYDIFIKRLTQISSLTETDEDNKKKLIVMYKQFFDFLIERFEEFPNDSIKDLKIKELFEVPLPNNDEKVVLNDPKKIKEEIDILIKKQISGGTGTDTGKSSGTGTGKSSGASKSNKKPIYTRRKYKNMLYHRQTQRV